MAEWSNARRALVKIRKTVVHLFKNNNLQKEEQSYKNYHLIDYIRKQRDNYCVEIYWGPTSRAKRLNASEAVHQ